MKTKNIINRLLLVILIPFVTKAEQRPNILFLFSDDQCFETIGSLGITDIETPNLDRLVKSGTTFTRAYNMGSWSGAVCLASTHMLNTGRFLWRAEEASKKAAKTARDTFEEGGLGSGLPELKIESNKIEKGIKILDLIADHKILNSKSEARRAIANKGFKINDIVIDNEKKIIQLKDFKKNILKLSYGKKKHYLVKII